MRRAWEVDVLEWKFEIRALQQGGWPYGGSWKRFDVGRFEFVEVEVGGFG